VLGQELAAVVYDLIYALETLYYKDKLAGDKEEFRADTEGIGVTGKARKLMEIQMARQTEIDKLTEISYGEPQTKLLHTKLLNKFVIKTFVEEIFLPDLFNKYPDLKDSMFMFGFGRLLSEYNKLGASAGSDVDSNIIVDFTKTGAVLCENEAVAKILEEELGYVQIVFKEYFNMDFEIDEYFTVRTFAEFEDAISSGDPATNKNLQFYLSIQKDYYRFSAPTGPLESAFLEHIEATRKMHGQTPVQAIFEETLNDSGKYSIGIIHGAVKTETDAKRQLTIAGGKKVREVIGSGKEEPDNWYFSMKYTVNRFYDFLYKLESLKGTEYEVGLADVGLTPDDVLFIKNANNMMLVLQNYAYTRHPEDCSYLSAEDFQELYVQADFPQGLKYLYIGDGLLLPDNFQTAFNIAVEKTEIFLNPLTKGVVGITKKYKELGHEFFQKLDKKMWEIHQKIAKSDALKN
jgi:hypothetical protein